MHRSSALYRLALRLVLVGVALVVVLPWQPSQAQQAPARPEAFGAILRLYGAQQVPEAIKLAEELLVATEKQHGVDHPEVANVLVLLGAMRVDRALIERALAIREKRLGANDPLIAEVLILLGKIRGFDPDAEVLLKRALAIMEKARPPGHPDVARILTLLHGFYVLYKRDEEATAIGARLEAGNAAKPQTK